MVVHQRAGVQGHVGIEHGFAQQMQIAVPIIVTEEAGQAIVATLDDMVRYAGEIETGQASHIASFAGWAGLRSGQLASEIHWPSRR